MRTLDVTPAPPTDRVLTPAAPPAAPAAGQVLAWREARPGDEHALSQLIRRLAHETYVAGEASAVDAWLDVAYGPATIRARIDAHDCLQLVCVDQHGEVHGASHSAIGAGPHDTDGVLGGTYLDAAARGRGLMVEAYVAVVEWLQWRGARRMLAHVHDGNLRARHLLEVVGFTLRAVAPDTLVHGMAWCEMTAEVPAVDDDSGDTAAWIVPL